MDFYNLGVGWVLHQVKHNVLRMRDFRNGPILGALYQLGMTLAISGRASDRI